MSCAPSWALQATTAVLWRDLLNKHRLLAEFASAKPRKFASASFVAAWTEECQQSSNGLKNKLTSSPVLAYADFLPTFHLGS